MALETEIEPVALLRIEFRRDIAERIIDVFFAVDFDREREIVGAQLQRGILRDDDRAGSAIEGRGAIGLAGGAGRL